MREADDAESAHPGPSRKADGPQGKPRKATAKAKREAQRPASGRAAAVLSLEPVARRVFAAYRNDASFLRALLRQLPLACRAFRTAFSPRLRLRRATFLCHKGIWTEFRALLPHLRLRKLTVRSLRDDCDEDELTALLVDICASPALQETLTKLAIDCSSGTATRLPSQLKILPSLRFIHLRNLSGSQTEAILRNVAPAQLESLKISNRVRDDGPTTDDDPTSVQLKVLERFANLRRLGLPRALDTMDGWGRLSTKAKAQLAASLEVPLFQCGGPKRFMGPAELAGLKQARIAGPEGLSLLNQSFAGVVMLKLELKASVVPLNESLAALGAMASLRELHLLVFVGYKYVGNMRPPSYGMAVAALSSWTRLSETRLERLSLTLPTGTAEKLPQLWAPATLAAFRLWCPFPLDPPLIVDPLLPDALELPLLRHIVVSGPVWLGRAVVGAGRLLAALEALRLAEAPPTWPSWPQYSVELGENRDHSAYILRYHARGPKRSGYSVVFHGKEVAAAGGVTALAEGLERRMCSPNRRPGATGADLARRYVRDCAKMRPLEQPLPSNR